jgi:galacturan 1,4-alpha-galacturonidase
MFCKMKQTAALALLSSTALAFPTILDPIAAAAKALSLASSVSNEYLEIDPSFYDASTRSHRKKCVLHPVKQGDGFDDENLLKAVEVCGNGGIIRLPDAN